MHQQLDNQRSVAPFRLDEPHFNADLFKALGGLAQLQAPLLERTFSVQLFGDSKRFEDLRPAVLAVLRRHSPFAAEYSGDDDSLLRAQQVQRVPEYVLLKGPLTLEVVGTQLALGPYVDGLSLPATMLRTAQVIDCSARAVITVENTTS